MPRLWQVRPTDKPGAPVEGCEHTKPHVHGTCAAYQACKCRCVPCRTAATARQREYSHREPHTDGRKRRADDTPEAHDAGKYLETYLTLDPNTARKAGLVVVCHAIDDADARDLLDVLGITQALRQREVA